MMRGILAVVAMVGMAAAQTPPPQQSKLVHGQGCVEAGVETSCLVVKDTKTAVLYNLLIKGARPALGEGIEFTGTPFHGMTACMQGQPVTVTSWARNGALKCAADNAPKE